MPAFRVTPLVVAIAGSLLCILSPVLVFFLLIKPTMTKIGEQQAIYQQNEQYVAPGALPQAQKKLDEANKQLALTEAQWDVIMKTRNPVIDVSDRFNAWKQYWTELEYTLDPLINRFWLATVYTKKRDPNAAIPLGSLKFAGPSSDPNVVASKGQILTIPLTMQGWGGTSDSASISVIGTFQGDLSSMARWNKCPRIVQVDGLTLSGYSPFITATYNAKIYEFITNADKPGPAVPTGDSSK